MIQIEQSIKPNYGVDAPDVMRNLLIIGILVTCLGWLVPGIGFLIVIAGLVPLTLGLLMLAYTVSGKFNYRDYVLKMIDWQGNENVLDIGTGRGLLMIGAAKHLTTGKAIGIDIWNAEDLSGNTAENCLKNVELERVQDRIELKTEDARKMSFSDESFDIILSTLCLHNIEKSEERQAACYEIARILKPGGTALISDYILTHEYAKALEEAGLNVKSNQSRLIQAYGLMWMVTATKNTSD